MLFVTCYPSFVFCYVLCYPKERKLIKSARKDDNTTEGVLIIGIHRPCIIQEQLSNENEGYTSSLQLDLPRESKLISEELFSNHYQLKVILHCCRGCDHHVFLFFSRNLFLIIALAIAYVIVLDYFRLFNELNSLQILKIQGICFIDKRTGFCLSV